MSIRAWVLGACVFAALGCPASSDGAPDPDSKADAARDDAEDDAGPSGGSSGTSSDRCARGQIPCGTGCIPTGGVCCDPVSTSYCTNSAGGGCNRDRQCSGAFPSSTTAMFCCATNADVGSNDCPAGQHHCGLSCRPTSQGCCERSTDLCTPDAANGGGMDAAIDAGTDGSVGTDAASTYSDAATSDPDGGLSPVADDTCCACNFDVYCTTFGPGGCWYCNEAHYDANMVCPAPEGHLTSPGPCACDPMLYQVCM